ncbi:MAG: B12-binding domain-containing radical SAM protein [Planctomycetia bacterium]|nr:B12-binding domain-containing radical SAM protein [Planctomycetia bacterium]
MRIVLFNTTGMISCDGARLISALLKRAGHSVKNVLLTRNENIPYQASDLACLSETLKECDFAMFAVYSKRAAISAQITEFIHTKHLGIKVIWGGPHCIAAPETSLRYADGVCFAEGDVAVVELVNSVERGSDYENTPNMAFKVNGNYKKNKVLPPLHDMDSLPYYDYDLNDYFVFDDKLSPVTWETSKRYFSKYPFGEPTCTILTSRGCPFACSYCTNARHIGMYGHIPMRFMSVKRIIDELEYTIRRFSFIKDVAFADDDFLVRDKKQLDDFARQYKERIGLPFGSCISAPTFRREKMEILLDTGLLRMVEMGVQSGSQRVLDEVFQRKIKVSKTKEVLSLLTPYFDKYRFNVLLDFIIDNPYETKDDIIQTYKYIIAVPRFVKIRAFLLAFFPGSPIYDRAVKDGIVVESPLENMKRFCGTRWVLSYQNNYETLLIWLAVFLANHPSLRRRFPTPVLRMIASRPVRKVASLIPKKGCIVLQLLCSFFISRVLKVFRLIYRVVR